MKSQFRHVVQSITPVTSGKLWMWVCSLLIAVVLLTAHGGYGSNPAVAKELPHDRVMKLSELQPDGSWLLPEYLGDRKIVSGGLYCFKPGETAHPEPRHVHDTEEVFIFVQGKGVLPIDGVDYPVEAGDVVIVHAGEDHHTRSSVEDPLVAAWYLMEKEESAAPAE